MERSKEFLEAKQLLIDDLSEIDNKVRIFYGNKEFSSSELLKEIKDETEFGVNHIEMSMKTLEKIKSIRNKNK